MSRVPAERPRNKVSILWVEQENFIFSESIQTVLGPTQAPSLRPIQLVTRSKRPEAWSWEVTSSTDVKNMLLWFHSSVACRRRNLFNFLNLALVAKHKFYRFWMPIPLLVISKTVLNLYRADYIRDNKISLSLYQDCQISKYLHVARPLPKKKKKTFTSLSDWGALWMGIVQ